MAVTPVNTTTLLNNVGKFVYFNSWRTAHNLKNVTVVAKKSSNSSDSCPRFYSNHRGRDGDTDTSRSGKKKEVWCNGLRKSLLSNLSGSQKSKLTARKETTFPETDKVWYENETNDKVCQNTKCNALDDINTSAAANMYNDEQCDNSKWSTVLQKSFDINMGDLSEVKNDDANKNFSMDINVIVKLKPQNSEVKIEQKEAVGKLTLAAPATETSGESITMTRDANTEEATLGNIRPEVMSYMVKLKNPVMSAEELKADENCIRNSIDDATSSYRQELVDELQQVYSSYKRKEKVDVPDELTDDQEPLDRVLNLSMAKKLYMISLQSDRLEKGENEVVSKINGEELFENSLAGEPLSANGFMPPEIPRFNNTSGAMNCSFLAMSLPHAQTKMFSTSAAHAKKDSKTDCDKGKKLPCLQSSELSKVKVHPTKGVCEKFCMPCCKPARDPPECFYPFHKPPCIRHKAPRCAYSECKMLFELKEVVPCECRRPRGTTCKSSKASEKCSK